MVAGATIALLALGLTAALPATAATPAQNRYSGFVQGDFTVAGNTFLVPSSFIYLDSDADPAVTDEPANAAVSIASSRAGFAIPPGSTIVAALLYAFQDYGGVPDPIGPPTLLFGAPGQSYASVSLTEIGRDSNQSRLLYTDVTSQLPTNDDGSVWVGVPASSAPMGSVRSWALFVVYTEPGAPWRKVVITDQARAIDSSFPTTSATVSDLVLPPSGQSDMTLAEYTFYSSVGHNDTLQVCAGTATCAPGAGTLASNAANPVNDIANLTMTVDGATMPNAFPATPANWAYSDLDLFPLDDVTMPPGTTSATITQRTTIDTLFNGVNALSMTTFAPIPSLVDTIVPSSTQHVGDELTYRLELTLDATGDSATDVVLTDVIPPEGSYVPGSATIAAGWNSGPMTDAVGDDQVEIVGSTLTWRVGSGASGVSGGSLAPVDGTQVLTFRVLLDNAAVNDVVTDDATATMTGVSNPLLDYAVTASASTDPLDSARRPIADSANVDGGRHRCAAGDVDRPRGRLGRTPRRWQPDELAHDPRRGQLSARPGDWDRDLHPRARLHWSRDFDRLPGDRRVRAERGLDLHPDGHLAAPTGATRPDKLWAARHLPDGHGPDPERRLCRPVGRPYTGDDSCRRRRGALRARPVDRADPFHAGGGVHRCRRARRRAGHRRLRPGRRGFLCRDGRIRHCAHRERGGGHSGGRHSSVARRGITARREAAEDDRLRVGSRGRTGYTLGASIAPPNRRVRRA